jgi:hypothetical protein
MHLLIGNSRMESHDYKRAIRSFERTRARIRPYESRVLGVVSLVSFPTALLQRIETARNL